MVNISDKFKEYDSNILIPFLSLLTNEAYTVW